METTDSTRLRRLELMLQDAQALPTLPAVVMRLMGALQSGPDRAAIIDLIRHDPSLTVKVLSECRKLERGRTGPAVTVEQAVERMGFDAVKNAAASVKVLRAFAESGADETDGKLFSYAGLWRHALAVGVAAELIAMAHTETRGIDPRQAFVAGLTHDIGKLALAHLMPKSYQRVAEQAEHEQSDIAEVERGVIGLDHQTVGKRLAEHWRLPHLLHDCIWLHGSAWESLPDLPHKKMVALVGLADLIARRQQIGYSGNFRPADGIVRAAKEIGLDPARVAEVSAEVQAEVERRIKRLAVAQPPTPETFLGVLLEGKALAEDGWGTPVEAGTFADDSSRVLDAIREFHGRASRPAVGVQDVLAAVAASAMTVLGEGYCGLLHQAGVGEPWLLSQYGLGRAVAHRQYLDPPGEMGRLSDWPGHEMDATELFRVLPPLAERLNVTDRSSVRAVPLPCGWGTSAVLLHDRRLSFAPAPLQTIASTWGASLAAAVQHRGARRLGEQLVETHRKLSDTQQDLMRSQSLARVGQVAAGAAHEMNNPLAIISGRAQLLSAQFAEGTTERRYAEQIWRQAERLSDMITALRIFAEPPAPCVVSADPAAILEEAVAISRGRVPEGLEVETQRRGPSPRVTTDPRLAAQALAELIVNAHESRPKGPIRLSVTVDTRNDRLDLRVADDGVGMDAATLEHAFDPFFSSKPAGRQAGLGLARARRLVEGLGGDIHLASRPNLGTTATLRLPLGPSKT